MKNWWYLEFFQPVSNSEKLSNVFWRMPDPFSKRPNLLAEFGVRKSMVLVKVVELLRPMTKSKYGKIESLKKPFVFLQLFKIIWSEKKNYKPVIGIFSWNWFIPIFHKNFVKFHEIFVKYRNKSISRKKISLDETSRQ